MFLHEITAEEGRIEDDHHDPGTALLGLAAAGADWPVNLHWVGGQLAEHNADIDHVDHRKQPSAGEIEVFQIPEGIVGTQLGADSNLWQGCVA